MKGILITILLLALIGFGIYWLVGDNMDTDLGSESDAAFCTLDAMLCPDGSYVGRIPPSCQFARCPSIPTGGSSTSSTSTLDVSMTSHLYMLGYDY